jgi:hypothetical protein
LTHATYGHMGLAKLKQLVSEGYIDKSKVENHAAAWFPTAGISMVMPAAFFETVHAKLEPCAGQQDLAATHVNHALHADLLHFPIITINGMQ